MTQTKHFRKLGKGGTGVFIRALNTNLLRYSVNVIVRSIIRKKTATKLIAAVQKIVY